VAFASGHVDAKLRLPHTRLCGPVTHLVSVLSHCPQ
jgi:hypothetical protein